MKKLISLMILFVLTLSTILFAEEKIVVITEEWPPYVYRENNQFKGFDYEVMIAVFDKMGYDVDFETMPWKRCIAKIKQKEADAILDISSNEDRMKIMYFPDEKLSDSASVLFHLKGRDFKFTELEDLKGYTIGTQAGYDYSDEITNADFLKTEEVFELAHNLKKLEAGRIDLFIANKNVGLLEAKKQGMLDKITYLSKEISGGDNFLAFSKKPKNKEIAEEFSKNLKEFKMTKEYKAILAKYGQ